MTTECLLHLLVGQRHVGTEAKRDGEGRAGPFLVYNVSVPRVLIACDALAGAVRRDRAVYPKPGNGRPPVGLVEYRTELLKNNVL